ncbi:MAG: chlorite dismutase family protein [Acidimicrobiales bacterium]
MSETLKPSVGWGVLHLFCKVGPETDAEAVIAAVKQTDGAGSGGPETGGDHQVVCFSVLGHKADLGFLAIGPDLVTLRRFQTALQRAGLVVADSYVSLTEVSEYAKGMPEEHLRARLEPKLPPDGKRAICFYPMSKRRGEADNWYRLDFDERKRLMIEHGTSGRRFAGRVIQLVTGSAGLDDFEWGVTLFGVHPDDLKETVYAMRFDEASALYGEFGPFYAGVVASAEEVLRDVGLI